MNFSFIDEMVAGSAGPLRKKEVDWLREKKGIGAILSVREGPLQAGWVEGLRYLNVPVRNHFPPTLDQLKNCVNFIMIETESGKKTTVHCAAGMGRTGTVLAAYLCYKYGLNSQEAITQVRAKRHGSIEKNQEPVISEYYNDLRTKKTA
jgi:atypical dual specificity phosphatase